MKRAVLMVVAIPLLLGGAGHARADLIGLTVDVSVYYPNRNTLLEDYGQQTVNPTATFALNYGETTTISNTQIIFTAPPSQGLFGAGSFNGLVYDFLNSGTLISGVTLDTSSTTLSGVTQSDVILASDGNGGQFVEINVAGLSFNASDKVTVNVTTLPEPSGIALLGLSVACLATGYSLWRRKLLLAAV